MENLRSERINKIARLIGAQRYLEVGVCQGTTFFKVDVRDKVAVDPIFQFDHQEATTARTTFHQVSSDAFFQNAPKRKFDLIYLDGLHTFEQTLRDFMNSLRLAHDWTVWVIDDTVPNDQYAALPDEKECFTLRHATGNLDWAWMGDVYKVVFFIGTIMKDFEFRTYTGHGQTVLWRSKTPAGPRESLPLSEIADMAYDQMLKHMCMMRPAPEDEILSALSALAHERQRHPRALFKRLRVPTIRGRLAE